MFLYYNEPIKYLAQWTLSWHFQYLFELFENENMYQNLCWCIYVVKK